MSSQSGYYSVDIVNPSDNYPVEIVYTDQNGQQQTFNIPAGSSTQGYIFVSEENPTIQVIVQKFAGGFVAPANASQETIDKAMQTFVGNTKNVECVTTPQPNNQVGYTCFENIPCYSFTVSGSGTITLDLDKINECAGHTQENGYFLPNQSMPTIAPPTGKPVYVSNDLGWMYPVQIDGVTVYSAWNKVYIPPSEQDNQQLLEDICTNHPDVLVYTNAEYGVYKSCSDILKAIQESKENRWNPDLIKECQSQGGSGWITVDGVKIACQYILHPQCFQPATVCIKGGANKVSFYEMYVSPGNGYCGILYPMDTLAYGTPTKDCFIIPKPVDYEASISTGLWFNNYPGAGQNLSKMPPFTLGDAWYYEIKLNSKKDLSDFPSDWVSECKQNPDNSVTENGVTIPCKVILAQVGSNDLGVIPGSCFKLMTVCFNQPGTFKVRYHAGQSPCGFYTDEPIAYGTITKPECVQIPVENNVWNSPNVKIDFTTKNGKKIVLPLTSYFVTVTIGEPSSSSSSTGSTSSTTTTTTNTNNTTTSTTGTSSNSNTTTPTTQSSQSTNKSLPIVVRSGIPYLVARYLSLEGHYLTGAPGSQQTTSGAQSSSTTGTQTPTSTPYTVDHYLSKIAQIEGSSSNTSTSITQSSQSTNKANNTTETQSSSTIETQTPSSGKQEQTYTQTNESHKPPVIPVNIRLQTKPSYLPTRPEPSHPQTKESPQNQNKKPEINVQHNEPHTIPANPVNTRLQTEPLSPFTSEHITTTRPEPSHPQNREENARHESHKPPVIPVNIRLQTKPSYLPTKQEPSHPTEQVHSKVSTSEHNISKHPTEHVNERVIKHETHSKRNVKKEERKKEHEKKNEHEKRNEEEEEIIRHLELYH